MLGWLDCWMAGSVFGSLDPRIRGMDCCRSVLVVAMMMASLLDFLPPIRPLKAPAFLEITL